MLVEKFFEAEYLNGICILMNKIGPEPAKGGCFCEGFSWGPKRFHGASMGLAVMIRRSSSCLASTLRSLPTKGSTRSFNLAGMVSCSWVYL